jgi:hypothetical protein
MNTLLLDLDNWDLCLDANSNIAMAQNPYSIAQDVASAVKLFAGELYYDNSKGMPYFSSILGENPSMSFVKSKLEAEALTVPEVVQAQVSSLQVSPQRGLTGQIKVIDLAGQSQNVSF